MTMMKRYDLFDGATHETIEADDMADAEDKAREWAAEGDWGDEGCTVDVSIREIVSEPDADREEYGDESSVSVDIDAVEPDCDDGEEHDLRDDPFDDFGCRSLGGTTLVSWQYCLRCGKERVETDRGSQRNPGESRVSVEWREVDDDEMTRIREHYGYEAE
jgi:hypothetical protein